MANTGGGGRTAGLAAAGEESSSSTETRLLSSPAIVVKMGGGEPFSLPVPSKISSERVECPLLPEEGLLLTASSLLRISLFEEP